MKESKITLFLWILLGAIVVLIIPIAIIDHVRSSALGTTATSSPSALAPAGNVPVGYQVGQAAPDFELSCIDNHDIKLSDYRGKKVILNFWATWCGPCRFETPFLQSISSMLTQKGVVLLAINTQDSLENAAAYAAQNKLDYVIPVDPRGTVAHTYNIRGIPTTFFIDERGIITSTKIGPFISEDEVASALSTDFK